MRASAAAAAAVHGVVIEARVAARSLVEARTARHARYELELLRGATVDFEDDMMKSSFVITSNPQSSASCGCGTSFQAKE